MQSEGSNSKIRLIHFKLFDNTITSYHVRLFSFLLNVFPLLIKWYFKDEWIANRFLI